MTPGCSAFHPSCRDGLSKLHAKLTGMHPMELVYTAGIQAYLGGGSLFSVAALAQPMPHWACETITSRHSNSIM